MEELRGFRFCVWGSMAWPGYFWSAASVARSTLTTLACWHASSTARMFGYVRESPVIALKIGAAFKKIGVEQIKVVVGIGFEPMKA